MHIFFLSVLICACFVLCSRAFHLIAQIKAKAWFWDLQELVELSAVLSDAWLVPQLNGSSFCRRSSLQFVVVPEADDKFEIIRNKRTTKKRIFQSGIELRTSQSMSYHLSYFASDASIRQEPSLRLDPRIHNFFWWGEMSIALKYSSAWAESGAMTFNEKTKILQSPLGELGL